MPLTPNDVLSVSVPLSADQIKIPTCASGVGDVIRSLPADALIHDVRVQPLTLWPDDRGYFVELFRVGTGLTAHYPNATTQMSGVFTHAGVIKAFHYHLRQYDCWCVVTGMLQVALVDLRVDSPTFGRRNSFYVGELRPWQILIPPGVAHGYKVIGREPSLLVYATSRFYDPADELRIPYDDPRLNYDWSTQFK